MWERVRRGLPARGPPTAMRWAVRVWGQRARRPGCLSPRRSCPSLRGRHAGGPWPRVSGGGKVLAQAASCSGSLTLWTGTDRQAPSAIKTPSATGSCLDPLPQRRGPLAPCAAFSRPECPLEARVSRGGLQEPGPVASRARPCCHPPPTPGCTGCPRRAAHVTPPHPPPWAPKMPRPVSPASGSPVILRQEGLCPGCRPFFLPAHVLRLGGRARPALVPGQSSGGPLFF